MEEPPVLPGAGLLPLTFEQSTILAQVEGARWRPTLRSKSTSSSLIRIAPFYILGKKVGKVLILEKRKTGNLKFREHDTEARWGCRQRKVKIKS